MNDGDEMNGGLRWNEGMNDGMEVDLRGNGGMEVIFEWRNDLVSVFPFNFLI